MHDWYLSVIRQHEQNLRAYGVYADDRIHILKPLGFEIFEENSTVYHHINRAQTLASRAYMLSELDACIRARIIYVAREPP